MKIQHRQSGATLTEMTVVVAVMTLLAALGLPAIHAFFNAFESRGSTKAMINAALASAKAIAAEEHRYAGIRFQNAYNPDANDADQYMIFIVHDPDKTTLKAAGFRAVEGLKPVKLPETVGVTDLEYNPGLFASPSDGFIDEDAEILATSRVMRDATTFSIVFSPSGRLVTHDVRVRNKDGASGDTSSDAIFNTWNNVANFAVGMFVQDDYDADGLGQELSRKSFVIYDKKSFRQAYRTGAPYSGYLVQVVPGAVYINPYTGTIISAD